MLPERLKKILNLIKKTGDRVVIYDSNTPDDSYVVMDLDSYVSNAIPTPDNQDRTEVMKNAPVADAAASVSDFNGQEDENINLTGGDLTDKINREISMWKNRDNSDYSVPENIEANASEDLKNEVKDSEKDSVGNQNGPKKAWQIPPQVKDKAQEIKG